MSDVSINNELSDACFGEFVKVIHDLTGISLGSTRQKMLEGRLRKRLRATETPDFESYLKLICKDQGEAEQFINQVTTNETYFYRTPRVWSYVSEVFLPQWLSTSGRTQLYAWSAAASTGAEAYTMGVIFEAFRKANPGFDYKILGTDIDSDVISVAEAGQYVGRPCRTVSFGTAGAVRHLYGR